MGFLLHPMEFPKARRRVLNRATDRDPTAPLLVLPNHDYQQYYHYLMRFLEEIWHEILSVHHHPLPKYVSKNLEWVDAMPVSDER
jgi:hypothetical protein